MNVLTRYRRLYQAANIAVLGLVSAVALLVAVTVLPGLVGFHPVVVLSGSMEPALNVGDIAVTRSVDTGSLKVGDVVTYKSGSNLITHRIIGISQSDAGRLLLVKGDANDTPDGKPVFEHEVVAKVVYGIRHLGFLMAFAESTAGMMLLIIAPLVGLALMWARDWDKKRARSTQAILQVSAQQVQGE